MKQKLDQFLYNYLDEIPLAIAILGFIVPTTYAFFCDASEFYLFSILNGVMLVGVLIIYIQEKRR